MIQIETILDILWKGFIIGVIVSAPLGPVGVLCIQRTLNKGRWYGFVTGIGASLSDIAYALLTGYGMSFVFDYVNKNIFYLQLFGSILLLIFGIYTFRSNPVQSIRPVSTSKGSYFHNFITAFAVTLSNPLIIFLFVGLFARFAFVSEGVLVFEAVTGYLAIALGALTWWFGITFFVNKVRTQFNLRGIWILNRIIGGIVMVVSAFGPLGPVGVLCIQRTLNKGRWYGFVTGIGASLSDIAYALLTGYGMSFVFDYVNKNIFYLQLFGSILLLIFGIYTFRSNPVQSIRPVSTSKGSYFHNFITAFAVTLSNPLIIFLFVGLFARFAFVSEGVLVFEAVTGYLAIALGALTWWFGITFFVNKVRTQFNLRGIWILNRIIGGIVMVVSAFGLVFTLMGESLY